MHTAPLAGTIVSTTHAFPGGLETRCPRWSATFLRCEQRLLAEPGCDWASGRVMERIGAMPRVGTVRCSVDSCRLKSETEEPGRFAPLDRSSGGSRTAAQAATTARKIIVVIAHHFSEEVCES